MPRGGAHAAPVDDIPGVEVGALAEMSRKGYPSHANPLDVDASMGL